MQLVARPSAVGSGQGKSRTSKKAKIRLIQTVCLPANSSAVVQVRVKRSTGTNLMLELDNSWHGTLVVSDSLLKNDDGTCGTAPIIVTNTSFSTQVLRKGAYLGKATTVSIVAEDELLTTEALTYSNEWICWQKQELRRQLQCAIHSYYPWKRGTDCIMY